jgi:RNA-binding protein 5/10
MERYEELKSLKIEKSKVKLSFCHPGVFVPSYEESAKYSFKTASGAKIAYWDEHGYASEWAEPKEERTSSKRQANKAQFDEEMEKFLNDIKRSEALHATAATIIQEPVMLAKPIEDKDKDTSKRESTAAVETAKKKRKVESITISRPAPAGQLGKWAMKKEELKASEAQVSEFADLSQMCCLLCKRKFQSIEEIQKHERLSKLHQSNLENESVRNSALAKIKRRTQQEVEYRDRAKERRIQFNQPDRPDLPHPNPRVAARQAAAKREPSPEIEPPKPNKGAKLLAAMGWTQGSGLGAEGSGIVEPIKAGQYAEGVGLGAGSMKVVGEDLANKEDDGSYRAYVRRVKDVARERYENASIFEEED